MSFPASAGGIAVVWIGVGASNPISVIALRIAGLIFRSSKVFNFFLHFGK
jgi:hypothetical protein